MNTSLPAIDSDLRAYRDGICDADVQSSRAVGACRDAARIDLRVFENLADVEAEWRTFERDADCTVFQSFDWLSIWMQQIGSKARVRPAIVVGRDAAGETMLILPLAIERSGFARTLVWLGSDLCDFNAPILSRRFCQRIDENGFPGLWRDATALLQSQARLGFDLVCLKKMPATVGAQKNPMLMLDVVLNPSGSYATELTGDWETFYSAKRSSSTRARERTKRRRLTECGPLAFVSAESGEDRLASLDLLMAQKSRAFARMGVSNLFEKPGHAAFYRALSTSPRGRSLVHISRLDCAGDAVAVNIGLTFKDTYYHLQASHDDGHLSRFGPGAAHLNEILRYAIARGFTCFDFTIGDEPYKRDWCEAAQPLYDHVRPASVIGACVYLPAVAKTWLTRCIKQSPALWWLFSRTRAVVGRFVRGRHTGANCKT